MPKLLHKYSYWVDTSSDTAAAKVVRMVGQQKRVLEIGAGPGSITRVLQRQNGCRVTAIEIDREAIKTLSPFCDQVVQCDLNDPTWPSWLTGAGKFDVIVAADVLEHLYNPWDILKTLLDFLNPDGYMVVSLPHAGHNAVIASLIDSDFGYRDWGLLDRTHIRFFGIKNIQSLFNNAGLNIVDAEFVLLPPEETELSDHWTQVPEEIKQCLKKNRFGNVYQIVLKAKPASTAMEGIQLVACDIPTSVPVLRKGTAQEVVLRMVRRYIIPWLPTSVRHVFHKVGLKF